MENSPIDIEGCLRRLSKKRPIFHSEADFQFALAWELQKVYPNAHIRLECRMPQIDSENDVRNRYVDILICHNNDIIPIELKYKTKKLNQEIDKELFALKEQGAQDIGRYDCVKDIDRLEKLLSLSDYACGYVIWLTNDPSYWSKPTKDDFYWRDFSIEDGKELHGYNEWHEASPGSIKGREDPIDLKGSYRIHWKEYCESVADRYGTFKYALLEILPKQNQFSKCDIIAS